MKYTERTLKTLIEYGNDLVKDPSKENIDKFADILSDFSDLSKVGCEHCKNFSGKIDNGGGQCKNCLYHYIRYSTHNFDTTPLNFELKKKK